MHTVVIESPTVNIKAEFKDLDAAKKYLRSMTAAYECSGYIIDS